MSDSQSTVSYRTIPQFPGYRIGDDGSVWSCRRPVGLGYGGGFKVIETTVWHLLKPKPSRGGYLQVTLSHRKVRKVHRLVLEAFVGPRPPRHEACHFPDRDVTNNRLSNLRWATKSDNMRDRLLHGTDNRGSKHPLSRLTDDDVRAIRDAYSQGVSQTSLARCYGMKQPGICAIVHGITWSHIR